MTKRKRSGARGPRERQPKLDAQEAYRQLRALRGKVDLTIDLERLREDRTFGHDEA